MTNTNFVASGVGKAGGYVFRAPLATALPTDANTALVATYINQGMSSNDGITRAINKAYEVTRDQRGDEAHRTRTEVSVTVELTLIESMNPEVAKTVFGADAVTVTEDNIAIAYKGEDVARSVWVFELAEGDNLRRFVAPVAQMVTEDFSQTFSVGEVVSFPVTLTLYKDASGNFFYDYVQSPAIGTPVP